ncbi:MAG: hypothetical protein AAGH89_02775 [Verrucomicrobiota bacterium]
MNSLPSYQYSPILLNLAVLDEVQWLIGQLQLANADIEAALDWFTTSEDDEGRRFDFAREVEIELALLEGNLTCLLADSELLNPEEATDFLGRAANTLHEKAMFAEAEFSAIRFSTMLHDLGNRYKAVEEQVGNLIEPTHSLNS